MTDFQPQVEQGLHGITLYQGLNYQAIVPLSPGIPTREGLHVQIAGCHDRTDNPREVLSRYLLALGSAKAIAESAHARDFWANTRIEAGQAVSAFGRVPQEENSWRKPVDTSGRNEHVSNLSDLYDPDKLKELFERYLPSWEKLGESVELFKEGPNGRGIDYDNKSQVVWKSDKYEVKLLARGGHLNGLHIMIDPIGELKELFERQWQTVLETQEDVSSNTNNQRYIQATLEATAIAMGIQSLLVEAGIMKYPGEIHNSGNWAGGLKPDTEGGNLSLNYDPNDRLALKREKRRHMLRIPTNGEAKVHSEECWTPLPKTTFKEDQSFGTSMHVHLYLPEEKDVVVLPKMSKTEAESRKQTAIKLGESSAQYDVIIAQWNEIHPPSDATVSRATSMIHTRLNQWLKQNCTGPLQPDPFLDTTDAQAVA